MIKPLTVGALVRRIEPPTNGLATVAAVDDSGEVPCYLIEYAEGGEGWWSAEQVEVEEQAPPTPDWPTFKGAALSHPALNQAIAAAIPTAPAAALALPAALLQAEQGATADFRGCWRAVCAAAPVAPATVAELVALAERCQLPAEFVAALDPAPELGLIRARDDQGRFIADDPATPQDEAWTSAD